MTRTEPNSSPSFIFSGCTANIRLHVIADVLSYLNSPFCLKKKKSLCRLINHLSAARKRELTHISFGFLYFPQITTKVTISIAYCIFSNNVISKSVFLVCCRIEYKIKLLLVQSVDSQCVSASNVGSWG